MKKVCKQCSTEFEDKTKNGAAKFCSIACRSAFKRPLYNKWKEENRDHFDEYQSNYYNANRTKRIKQSVDLIKSKPDKYRKWYREYQKRRSKEDIVYRLSRNIRSRLKRLLNGKRKSGFNIEVIGCSSEFLRTYLESKFLPGMTWDNYGEWHIDHIKPLASFNLTKKEELQVACHYTNLQPLWAIDNLKKGTK